MSVVRHPLETAPAFPARGGWRIDAPRTRYDCAVPADDRRRLALAWLALALGALIGAGLFSVLLVAARTPYVQRLFTDADFFRAALVAHVNLSGLVWFLALGGVLWTLNSTARLLGVGWAAWLLASIGAAMMAAASFIGHGPAVMSNYVPVLDRPAFLWGLAIFGAGVALLVVRAMSALPRLGGRPDGDAAARFGLNAAAVASAVALGAFAWSYGAMPAGVPDKAYYEVLFWGGGHVLQYAYTLLMLTAWLWLASACGALVPLTPRVTLLMFAIALAPVFATPLVYLAYGVASAEHRWMLTWLMKFSGGLAIAPAAAAVVIGLVRASHVPRGKWPLFAALVCSIVLFGSGGLIGFMIEGSNVTVPAHYHGCIVGVTLALMGLVYMLLPRLSLGLPDVRLATLQPCLYALGQLLHIAGLVWCGGYGVQRKVAGAEQVLRSAGEVAGMALMGLGGFIAVVGGLLFILIVARAGCCRGFGARA